MKLLLFKSATTIKNPGSRGGKFWRDEKGNIRYDEKPSDKTHKYLAVITLSDGTKKYIVPQPEELDENGQLKGGQAAIREIMNRELFGDYGFFPPGHKRAGEFWQNKGILIEYKTRTTASGKIVVDEVQRHKGYTALDLRDSSVERAYGKGLPRKITQYATEATPHEGVPNKDKIEVSGTHDVPPIEELGIHSPRPRLPATQIALDEPLKDNEDPVVLATAYLDAFLNARAPSKAKTPEGQARARAAREGQFDEVVGARQVKPLPAWAVNKWRSAEELQHDLSRDIGGKPLSTLITLGLWNPDNKSKRAREQLVSEWAPFIRRWARRLAGVYAGTDVSRAMSEQVRSTEGYSSKLAETSQKRYMYDRERDLYQQGVVLLLDEANKYVANDEPHGQYSRFDLRASNVIKNELERMSKQAAIDNGAMAIEDVHEEESYRAPKMISPREHFEVRHYAPIARAILDRHLAELEPHERAAFKARLWMDDDDHPDTSHERRHQEARERQRLKQGRSATHWGRPWTRSSDATEISSVADQLADTTVTLRGGKTARLGDLEPQHQKYYLEQWYNDAQGKIEQHLKTKSGGLTADGVVVQKWLRLEAKLAGINRREIQERTSVPIAKQSFGPSEPKVGHVRAQEHPAVTFFRQPGSNRDLAQKLGIANDLDLPVQIKNVALPKQHSGKASEISRYHQLALNLRKLSTIDPKVHAQLASNVEVARNAGSWTNDKHGNPEWHEQKGVAAFHEATVRTIQSRGADNAAVSAMSEAADTLGGDHPMVQDYKRRLATLDTPNSTDLASWKTRSHAAYREQANRLHVLQFEMEQRQSRKSLKATDLTKAFAVCLNAYDRLGEALR